MAASEPWRAKATAALQEARKKNGRLGVKKRRTGCTTCKERHIKCDEGKPECQKCLSSSRRCGYTAPPTPGSLATSSPPLQQGLDMTLHLQEGERRTYDFFLSVVSERLAGPLGKRFWYGHILQLAQSEPLVKDSILAISTLYEHPQFLSSFRRNPYVRTSDEAAEAKRKGVLHPGTPGPPDVYHAAALRKYNAAIARLKERLERGDVEPWLALTSCCLFYCIEVIRDNVFAALALVNHGVEMVKSYSSFGNEQGGLMRMFKLMFSRMGVTAATIGHALPTQDLPRLTSVGEVEVFADLEEARDALFAIMADSRDYLAAATGWREAVISASSVGGSRAKKVGGAGRMNRLESCYGASYTWTDKKEMPPRHNYDVLPTPVTTPETAGEDGTMVSDRTDVPMSLPENHQAGDLDGLFAQLQTARAHILDQLDWWLKTCAETRNEFSHIDPGTAAFLMMYYHATLVWTSTRLDLAETIFDTFTYDFDQIVHNAHFYLGDQSDGRATFTFENGAVAPLFLTATRCRVPSLRRRALDLMKRAPRKECFHGAESTAEIACRVIEIEEDGLGHPAPDCSGSCATMTRDEFMPAEERRVHSLELSKPTPTCHEITVTRYSMLDGLFVPSIETLPI